MQSSPYNNPMFAQGLSGLIQGMIGTPEGTAKNEMMASEALLNNQTAQYREAIGDTGLSGDLASMMVRALQAGPGYSGNAPKIGDAAIKMGALGFGSPELTPSGPIAAMIQQSMMKGGARGGGKKGPDQFDADIGADAAEAIAQGADPDAVYNRAISIQKMRRSGIPVT